ncbi:winged helix DNA-binding domain-containing protein [Streptomyces armeniacus]|uniref:Winged helix DNA-binding domain-containing protein n=1 Tax=Streptomyces armeniacus TaxID=83291 RepID=A0A345XUZ0_9ACTN|nr:winged helix DNA-binding domain-containing protein [Streptomyces armeniacus]AXK35456.1 winged helix DNA-binding domain-containing protein [Streptomyces armeniacus]AZY92006.1 hypothetical protein [Streptomyces armeniacus]
MPPEKIGLRALNRAYLARQLLVERSRMSVLDAVEHLVGLQAQAPKPPYFGLWSRVAGFRPDQLGDLLLDRSAVRIALMRGTVHLVSARDCRWLRPLTQVIYERTLPTAYGRQLAGADPAEIAAAGAALLAERPRTAQELGSELQRRWPEQERRVLSQVVRFLLPVVQLPPRGLWGHPGQPTYDTAERWTGEPLAADASPERLVRRYLAAFGPASVRDVQVWSGLTRLNEVLERLRPELRTFAAEDGRELFDLPDAPRPDPGLPVPVRYIAEYDNLILSHADRTRVISEPYRRRIATRNGQVPGTFLVDGTVRGSWRTEVKRKRATLTVTPFERLPRSAERELEAAGGELLAFAAEEAAEHEVRFDAAG